MGESQVPAIADPPFQTYSVSLTIVLTVSLYRTAELELESGNFELYLILHTHFLPCDDTLILKHLLHSKRLELLLTFGLQWQVKNIPWGYLRFKTYNLQYAQPVCFFYLEENSLSPSLICLGLPMKSTLQLQLKYSINIKLQKLAWLWTKRGMCECVCVCVCVCVWKRERESESERW